MNKLAHSPLPNGVKNIIIMKLRVLKSHILNLFTKGHKRSVKAKKNIAVSFFLKGLSILISLALVPITLNYLGPTKYGIWLTISSVTAWIGFFDIGLGNGLRNKFAEALAKNRTDLAKMYVSTTYAAISIIVMIIFLILLIIQPFLNWTKIFNTTPNLATELTKLVFIVFTFFMLRFVSKLIGIILVADQKPAINDCFNVISNLLSLIIIYFLAKITSGSLLYIGITLSSIPVFILLLASVFFYAGAYKSYRPSFTSINFKYFKELASLGGTFFIIQIAALILFSTDNMIITQLYGPAEVTPYNIAFKYFSIIIMIFAIIRNPFWSAYTEAYCKNEFTWIRNSIRKLIYLWAILVGLVLIMLFLSSFVYEIWIGKEINVPFKLSIGMALFAIVSSWSGIFSSFLNGVGKIRLQLYGSILLIIINIPLSILFAKYLNLGTAGVILATCFCLFIGAVLSPIQYYKIINNKAYGIWVR